MRNPLAAALLGAVLLALAFPVLDLKLDLREVITPGETLEVETWSLMGDVKIVVPPGTDVVVNGGTLLGDVKTETDPREQTARNGARLVVRGYTLMGDVVVREPGQHEAGAGRNPRHEQEQARHRVRAAQVERLRVQQRGGAVGPQPGLGEGDGLAGGEPAGVAPRGAGGHALPVQDRDVHAPFLQMPGRAEAHDSSADDECSVHADQRDRSHLVWGRSRRNPRVPPRRASRGADAGGRLMATEGASSPSFRDRATFVRISNAGLRESHAHDVTITRESPNYRLG